MIFGIIASLALSTITANETTFADDVRACHERATYAESRACIENIWQERDDTMRHCANDEETETNCIWEGAQNGWRYVDVDGIAYYIRMDHITMHV